MRLALHLQPQQLLSWNEMQFINQLIGNNIKINVYLRNHAFYPGNVVEGFAEIVVSQPTPFRAIRIRVACKEHVHVERKQREQEHTAPGQPPRYKTVTITRDSRTALYKQLITVAGSMKTNPIQYEGVLPVGTFYYPFAFQLPKNIPPSFSRPITDDYADIQYYVKCYVDVPMGRDAQQKVFFSVIRPMPASQYALTAPYAAQNTYDVTCCCCVSKGEVTAKVYCNRTIIALDRDTIECFVDIDNTRGEEPVDSVVFSLANHVSYSAGGMTESHVLDAGSQELKDQKILPGAKGTLSGRLSLNRSALPSIRTTHITSRYVLTCTFCIPWATDPVQAINVIVGQSVDESNWSETIPFDSPPLQPLPKGRLTVPEAYYAPPPTPVFQYAPPALGVPPSASYAPATYQFNLPPFGVPDASYQNSQMCVMGQNYNAPSSGSIVWQSGVGPC